MKATVFLIFSLLFSFIPVFADSHPEYLGIENPSEYFLKIEENEFSIPYEINGTVIAMDIDQELTSLLIAIETNSDTIFKIDLDHQLINAYNNEFAILVNGYEVDYEIVSDADSTTLTFFVPVDSEEIEIIGTHVIPEFPLGALTGFLVLIMSVMILSRTKLNIFKL